MNERDESHQTEGPKPLPGAVAFLSMGLSAAICVGIGVVLGLWVDSLLHTGPIFLLVGLAMGVTLAALGVVRQIRSYL